LHYCRQVVTPDETIVAIFSASDIGRSVAFNGTVKHEIASGLFDPRYPPLGAWWGSVNSSRELHVEMPFFDSVYHLAGVGMLFVTHINRNDVRLRMRASLKRSIDIRTTALQ
jgi:hypothetical protein